MRDHATSITVMPREGGGIQYAAASQFKPPAALEYWITRLRG